MNQLFQREYLLVLYRKNGGDIHLYDRMNRPLQAEWIPLGIFKIKGIIPKVQILLPKGIRSKAFE